jgi:hypothetical protein
MLFGALIARPAASFADPPGPADLAETIEVKFTPAITELAASLDNGARHVRTYAGSPIAACNVQVRLSEPHDGATVLTTPAWPVSQCVPTRHQRFLRLPPKE